jgi:hypothetical protein
LPERAVSVAAEPSYEELIGLWLDGQRRLRESEPSDRAASERVVEELLTALRRRLGGQFTVAELAQLYLTQGTDWCFEIAVRVAPGTPAAWDMTMVAGTAFARYAREAVDYATGRRLLEE